MSVSGRYPYLAVFSAENITATAELDNGVIRIRLDDERYPDAWMELIVRAAKNCTDRPLAVKPLHPGCDSGPPVQAG